MISRALLYVSYGTFWLILAGGALPGWHSLTWSTPGVVRPGRMRAIPGPARRTLSRRSPGALQPSQARRSIARVQGKGSAGFRCQISHIAGMRTLRDVGGGLARRPFQPI